jgi:hypothetical protein
MQALNELMMMSHVALFSAQYSRAPDDTKESQPVDNGNYGETFGAEVDKMIDMANATYSHPTDLWAERQVGRIMGITYP